MIDDQLGKRFFKKEMIILGGTLAPGKNCLTHEKHINELVNKIKEYCT